MFNNIEVIFIDLDKTLTTRKKKYDVSLDNRLQIKNLQKRKIWTVIATGRSREDIVRIWNQIHLNKYSDFVIYSNGAIIENFDRKIIIHQKKISFSDILIFLKYLRENHPNWIFRFADSSYFYSFSKKTYKQKIFSKLINDFELRKFSLDEFNKFKNFETSKIGIIGSLSKKRSKKIIDELEEKFPQFKIVISGFGIYIELTAEGVTKGSAAIVLADYLKFNLNNSIAIGDSLNDKSLFEIVGYPVAMKNSNKELLKIAKFTTKTAKKNGVAKVINDINI
ncbi:HAD family hydrolase [Candidatus Hepatoplasma crinochetorum]|uniref:Putative phosphatase YwpJ n=1 Tax=Candidatus Hepatoplasma crinochetorum Av TaxID=1427984 RepID=W8GMH3_9MOLU|nr:HAD family hydrolase [Candidatus Hepatoplasma crinochetorum]AHK22226.1 putative phosphatase YwpJ [Candidatus Hepatoplasma crinochetorum Av]BDV02813.1 MAG: haloacid dehalogenase [Candidatus Hepatoplasma crinochetorum]